MKQRYKVYSAFTPQSLTTKLRICNDYTMKKSKAASPNKIHAIYKKIPSELTTVTRLSKTFAALVFITLPFIGFLLGIRYKEIIQVNSQQSVENVSIPRSSNVICAQDAFICPDGTWIGRTGPHCEFSTCPKL